jgi:hypothetical protein
MENLLRRYIVFYEKQRGKTQVYLCRLASPVIRHRITLLVVLTISEEYPTLYSGQNTTL